MIDRKHKLPVSHQCTVLGLARSSAYSTPRDVSPADLALMRRMDELHLEHPFAGTRMLRDLLRPEGFPAGRKHIGTLRARMGIEALYRKPHTSRRQRGDEIHPYLLRDLAIERPNQVWAADITTIPMRRGFLYLFAVIDGYSRRVLAWRLSNTLTTDFCLDAVREAIHRHGCPEIFNTDQGSPFTSGDFTGLLKAHDIRISMDGKGPGGTTSSSSACGKASSTKRSISRPTTALPMRKPTWERICTSTTSADRIVPWKAKHRTRPTSLPWQHKSDRRRKA